MKLFYMKMYLTSPLKTWFFYLLLFLAFSEANAQNSFSPQRLDNTINSEYTELNPVISPDGKRLYFCRQNHPENTFGVEGSQDIWFSERLEDNTWSVAQRMPYPFNTSRSNSILSISSDGNTYMINGIYSKKKVEWIKRGMSIITKTGNSWSNPVKIKIPAYSRKNKGETSNSYLSADGKVLMLSFTKKWMGSQMNLYVCKQNSKGKWKKPKKLKDINKKYKSVESPFLSSDGNILYLSVVEIKDGNNIIVQAKRADDTYKVWSGFTPLHDPVNSDLWDSYYKTNDKGSWAYFCSNRNLTTQSDIFQVKIFEENPFVVLSGVIINTTKNAPLASRYKFNLLADGKEVDSLIINNDSATYHLKLPLGKKYSLVADVDKFISTPEIIDVSDIEEYTERKQDLKVTPLSYVQVKGRLLNKTTGDPLTAADNPKIAINGVIDESAVIDFNTEIYKVNLSHGKTYSLQVIAEKFNPVPEYLDLLKVDEYREFSKDLYAEEVKAYAIVTGKVFNKKTHKPMAEFIDYHVAVNDVKKGNTKINKTTAEYYIEIPIGQVYTINAGAPKYFPLFETIDLSKESSTIKIYKDLYLAPLEIGSAVKLNNVFFDPGSSELKPESFLELNKIVAFLNEYPEVTIEIGGHTDNVGSAQKNLVLSDKRAAAVVHYIEAQGIKDERISSKGYGMTKPVVPNTTKANKAKNRRVEFIILDI